MDLLSVDELKALVDHAEAGLCVSIYLPTYQAGSETQQNAIRFKNLMRQAEERLQANQLSHTEALRMLAPAQQELDREDFWQHQHQGLAIFITANSLNYYRLPLHFEEMVVVSDHFHLKPLLPLLSGNGKFYILALSQQQIRLLEGDRYHIREMELEDVPQSLEEALQYDRNPDEGQFRISTSKGGTNNSFPQIGSSHGQGGAAHDDINRDVREILQFLHQVDRGLHPILRNEKAPLVLAGVEYLFPIYREANTYPHLVAAGITGNPETLKPEELHAQAWEIVEPLFQQSQEAAVAHYNDLSGTEKISTDVKEAVPAAFYGRVDQLFVAVGVQQWGRFDPTANQIELHPVAEPGDEDLLDLAAIQTLLNGGTVFAVEPEQVPDAAPLAAVFRY